MAEEIYFFDLSKGGDLTGSGDITLITDEQAVIESVYNILLTQPGERVMFPEFGCGINKYLFEPIDSINNVFIEHTIKDAINIFEKRIINLSVEVLPDEDNNTYIINIAFSVTTNPAVIIKFETTLKKLR